MCDPLNRRTGVWCVGIGSSEQHTLHSHSHQPPQAQAKLGTSSESWQNFDKIPLNRAALDPDILIKIIIWHATFVKLSRKYLDGF